MIPDIPEVTSIADLVRYINDRLHRLEHAIPHTKPAASTSSSSSSSNVVISQGQPAALLLSVPGTLSIRSNAAPLVMLSTDRTPKELVALLKQAPLGGSLSLRIRLGLTQWGSIVIPSGQTEARQTAGFGAIAAERLITLDITGVGLTFPGADLSVLIRF